MPDKGTSLNIYQKLKKYKRRMALVAANSGVSEHLLDHRSTDGAPEVVINLSSIYHWKFDLLERVQPEEECLSRC